MNPETVLKEAHAVYTNEPRAIWPLLVKQNHRSLLQKSPIKVVAHIFYWALLQKRAMILLYQKGPYTLHKRAHT